MALHEWRTESLSERVCCQGRAAAATAASLAPSVFLPSRMMNTNHLIVFLKAPRPGFVKTRVAATAGRDKACAIYRELVETLLAGLGSLDSVELRFWPDDAAAEIKSWLREGWTAEPQGEGDLGDRLRRAFASAFNSGAQRVVIIGSDCPEVEAADIRSAWRELAAHDLVVGPAVDGGYWLIGLSSPQPKMFAGIAWSSDQVLGQTLQLGRELGLRIQLLRILTDIDTEEDWNAYVRQRP